MTTSHDAPLGALVAWVQRFASDATVPRSDAEVFGRMAFLAEWLRRAPVLPRLPQEHREALESAFTIVPVQAPTMPGEHPAFAWLQVASLAEFHGQRSLAQTIVDALAGQSSGDPEVLAMCAGQRGRIARTAGDLDDAAAHYADAIRLTTPLPKRDAWPRALCGLANVHLDRGNFPAAERCLRRALKAGPQVAAPTRVHPWMGLALVRRKRNDPIDAMLCAWNAFDLTTPNMPQRADLLVTLAECATEFGDHTAAVNGFEQALVITSAMRVRAAALTGIVRARTAQVRRTGSNTSGETALAVHDALVRALELAVTRLDELLIQSLAPQEETLALLARAEANVALRYHSESETSRDAEHWLTRADTLIDRHGYHEYRFQIDAIRHQIAGALATSFVSAASDVVPTMRRGPHRPAVVQRLAEYTTEGAMSATAG